MGLKIEATYSLIGPGTASPAHENLGPIKQDGCALHVPRSNPEA